MQEVNSALSRVQLVGYSQKVVKKKIWNNTLFLHVKINTKNTCLTVFFKDFNLPFQKKKINFFPGAVWSCAGLPVKLWLLTRKLQLDHPVPSWESGVRVGFIAAHHTPTGTRRRAEQHRRKIRKDEAPPCFSNINTTWLKAYILKHAPHSQCVRSLPFNMNTAFFLSRLLRASTSLQPLRATT